MEWMSIYKHLSCLDTPLLSSSHRQVEKQTKEESSRVRLDSLGYVPGKLYIIEVLHSL